MGLSIQNIILCGHENKVFSAKTGDTYSDGGDRVQILRTEF